MRQRRLGVFCRPLQGLFDFFLSTPGLTPRAKHLPPLLGCAWSLPRRSPQGEAGSIAPSGGSASRFVESGRHPPPVVIPSERARRANRGIYGIFGNPPPNRQIPPLARVARSVGMTRGGVALRDRKPPTHSAEQVWNRRGGVYPRPALNLPPARPGCHPE